MKPKTRNLQWSVVLATLTLLSLTSAQTQPAMTDTEETALKAAAAGYSIIQRGPHDRVWSKTSSFTDAEGVLTVTTNSFTEVASGMHYLDNGEWKESQDLIELTPEGGAAATQGPCKAYFRENLAGASAIKLITSKGRPAETRPLGLFYHDVASGKTVQIATLRDCNAELLPPNQIVWKSIFDTIEADFRVTYTKALIEGDLILRQRPKPPQAYDPALDPATTRLELWHEWRGLDSPKQRHITVNRPAAVKPGEPPQILEDNLLDFGDLFFVHGRAFSSDGVSAGPGPAKVSIPNPQDPAHIPVAKDWLDMVERSILVEGVCWPDIEPQLASLPEMASTGPLPQPKDRLLCLREAGEHTYAPQPNKPIEVATIDYQSVGVVLDWITVPEWGTDYQFNTDATYYILNCSFGGHVTFGNRAVLKFAPEGYLLLGGTVTCNGSWSIERTLLTSRDDDLFGVRLDGLSSHYPTYAAHTALCNYFAAEPTNFRFMRIRWAHTGIYCNGSGSLYGSSLEMCEQGILLNPGPFPVTYSTRCGVDAYQSLLTDDCPGDGDSDGLPDVWECKFFGNKFVAQPGDDSDGDCTNNLVEYNAHTSPHTFPDILAQPTPAEQAVHTGANVTYSVQPVLPACLRYQWYRSPNGAGQWVAIPGATNSSFHLNSVAMSDYGYYKVQVISDWSTNESSTVLLMVNDDFCQAVWESYQQYDAGQPNFNHAWAQRSRPPGWPTTPPQLAWNNNTVLSRFANRSAIAGDMYHPGDPNYEHVPYIAISRRHAYLRGHGNGACGPHDEWENRKVWFCRADNGQVVEATVWSGYTYFSCPGSGEDFSIVLFKDQLPFAPAKVMVAPAGEGLPGHVNYIGNVQILDIQVNSDISYGPNFGASGTPILIPAPSPDNSLVFIGGETTTGPSAKMEWVMAELCTLHGLNTNAPENRLTWYSYP